MSSSSRSTADVVQRPREQRTRAYVTTCASHFDGGMEAAARIAGLNP
jgi:hypothetical protein